MGIESDQLVYDYLSRVGDLAQQRQLPASDRMKLVSTLRNEIDRRRATYGEESPAAVRGILGALGTPDEVVERADEGPEGTAGTGGTGGTAGTAGTAGTQVPSPRSATAKPAKASKQTKPRKPTKPAATPPTPPTPPTPSVPQSRDSGGRLDPDWWRTDATHATDIDVTEGLPGFVGGIERPDLFEPPAPAVDEDEEYGDEDAAPGRWRRVARVVLRRKKVLDPDLEEAAEPEEAETAPGRPRLANPFVLLAALLLLGGAVFGSLVALAAGWLIAYASRRLTPGEIKAAVLVIPGLSATAGAVWLWGRVEGRWGEAVAPGGPAMSAAIAETWPWVLRGAAVASALFLLWRSRRH
ncbi:hypothetical protein ACI2LO_11240 [Streptomyces sp. NPDC033754]|uniref:hypothetical protein n=1 Tax=unclassified Streptomyces TaxID=2593676 RepID=UPI0033F57B1C